jgi:hypothetical protein
MHHRSKLVLAMGALLLATPALSSCGFNLGTDRINTVQHGGTQRDASVDVLAAVIVSGTSGSGTLSGRLVNNVAEPNELGAVSAAPDAGVTASEFEPVEIPAAGTLALADVGEGLRLDGDFDPGDVITLTFELGSGESVDVEVPVVRECGFYEGLDSAPEAESGSAEKPEEISCEAPEEEAH